MGVSAALAMRGKRVVARAYRVLAVPRNLGSTSGLGSRACCSRFPASFFHLQRFHGIEAGFQCYGIHQLLSPVSHIPHQNTGEINKTLNPPKTAQANLGSSRASLCFSHRTSRPELSALDQHTTTQHSRAATIGNVLARGSRSDCSTPPLGFPSGAAEHGNRGFCEHCRVPNLAYRSPAQLPGQHRCPLPAIPRWLPMKPIPYHGVSPRPGTWRIPPSCSQLSPLLSPSLPQRL